jgi:predicted transcriptional regulator
MNAVRYARLRAGLTQVDLAKKAGISQPALARIESGRITPRVDTVERLLRACGMTLEVSPLAGVGIDRTAIRRMLKLSPRQRLQLATKEAHNLASLRRR